MRFSDIHSHFVYGMASHFYEYRDASDRSAYLTMINAFHALLYPYRKIEDMF